MYISEVNSSSRLRCRAVCLKIHRKIFNRHFEPFLFLTKLWNGWSTWKFMRYYLEPKTTLVVLLACLVFGPFCSIDPQIFTPVLQKSRVFRFLKTLKASPLNADFSEFRNLTEKRLKIAPGNLKQFHVSKLEFYWSKDEWVMRIQDGLCTFSLSKRSRRATLE